MSADILIVGAGPTGLTLACHLLQRGVGCRVVDQSPEPTSMSRAIGLSTRSLEIFDDIGASADLVDAGQRMHVVNFHARGRRIGQIRTSLEGGTRFPYMLCVPQSTTERTLDAHVRRLGGSVERAVQLVGLRASSGGDGVDVTLEKPAGEREEFRAPWVVGADGAHSAVRKHAGIGFAGTATDVVFVIVDAQLAEPPPAGEGQYFFSPKGLLVVIPLPDGSHRLAATLRAGEPRTPAIDVGAVQALVRERGAGDAVRVTELRDAGWGAAAVRIHSRLAERFRSGRCLIAGDAAHIYSPVGGQGMNSGIQDAHNLAWKLALVSTGQASDALLDTYEIERAARAKQILKENRAQTKLATMGSRVGAAMQRAVMSRASKPGAVNRKMVGGLAQLDVDYGASPGVVSSARRSPAGKRIPDTALAGAPDAPPTLHRMLNPDVFTLLVLAPQRAQPDAPARTVREQYGSLVDVASVRFDGESPAAPSSADLVDAGDELRRQLGGNGTRLYLVRPDRHIAYAGPLASGEELVASLDGVLCTLANARPPG